MRVCVCVFVYTGGCVTIVLILRENSEFCRKYQSRISVVVLGANVLNFRSYGTYAKYPQVYRVALEMIKYQTTIMIQRNSFKVVGCNKEGQLVSRCQEPVGTRLFDGDTLPLQFNFGGRYDPNSWVTGQ